jgi:hypothetical protein
MDPGPFRDGQGDLFIAGARGAAERPSSRRREDGPGARSSLSSSGGVPMSAGGGVPLGRVLFSAALAVGAGALLGVVADKISSWVMGEGGEEDAPPPAAAGARRSRRGSDSWHVVHEEDAAEHGGSGGRSMAASTDSAHGTGSGAGGKPTGLRFAGDGGAMFATGGAGQSGGGDGGGRPRECLLCLTEEPV